jgi:hypothetical protein
MFVYTASKPDAKAFAQAMKNGRAYASFGPMIYPKNVMFGDTLKLAKNQQQSIRFDLLSVNGLKSVQLIGNDGVISEQTLSGEKASVVFAVPQKSAKTATQICVSLLPSSIWCFRKHATGGRETQFRRAHSHRLSCLPPINCQVRHM